MYVEVKENYINVMILKSSKWKQNRNNLLNMPVLSTHFVFYDTNYYTDYLYKLTISENFLKTTQAKSIHSGAVF